VQLRRQAQSYLIDHQQQILLLQNASETGAEKVEKAANDGAESTQQQ
jgi:sigma-E factor negative regulatory protein RseA